jgi:tRNA threonylcarbamoyladenosine dehydratase
VGSFAAEALARSAVGKLALIDFDEICITNVNRQLHALKGNVGRNKVDVMAERLRLIHPASEVTAIPAFYNEADSDKLLSGEIDFVVDAIDNVTAKAHLIATCLKRGLPRWAQPRAWIPRAYRPKTWPRRTKTRSRATCASSCASTTAST